MISQFVNGLKDEIKAEIRLLNPDTLEDIMDAAMRVEGRDRVNGLRRSGVGPTRTEPFCYFHKNPVKTSTSGPRTFLSSNNYNALANRSSLSGRLLNHDLRYLCLDSNGK